MADNRLFVTLACALGVTAGTLAQSDWKTYGNDPGHARFSTLTQITPQNVTRLTRAWEFDTKTAGRKWQNTPVVINNIMYITLQNGGVVALEPETGREVWRFETPVRGRSVRAIAYWPGDADASISSRARPATKRTFTPRPGRRRHAPSTRRPGLS